MSVMPAVSGVSGTTGVPGVSGASAGLPGAPGVSPGASGTSGASGEAGDIPAPLAARARLFPALAAVYRAQLSRARVARIPLLFVATFQSIGIMILMRGVVDGGSEARSVVAGSSVLVVAFVALNLLAQYFGQLRASGGLDHYATLPVPPSAVVLGRPPPTPPSRCPEPSSPRSWAACSSNCP
ncbi:hypothetical protein SANT12839_029320 [Streptomyces antimycoticus]|uniref:Uncharacterized protein n=1 Tax=Streptomyces antimycoticus TaxID=68175 RepID=A0A4D4K4W1_9ACTN|nr:hypothetical protein SANT12839_029320 [Streptomyces antimycoticus]